MKCTLLKDAMAVATRARINGEDWIVLAGDETIALRRPSSTSDPRVLYTEMKFGAEQEVLLEDGCITAIRCDKNGPERVAMWLYREVAITVNDLGAGVSVTQKAQGSN